MKIPLSPLDMRQWERFFLLEILANFNFYVYFLAAFWILF